jgi:MFS superfamily sulfate permease-like transporter
VTIDASRSKHLDEDVVELLHDFRQAAPTRGVKVRLAGIPGAPASIVH